MSHTGNRRLRQLQSHSNKEAEPFYNPSVFRYKCIGYLQLNSSQKGNPGTCRGFQSSLERVANMVPDTREGALKKFLDASADLGTYVDSDDSSDQKVKEIYTARTMIYKEDDRKDENIKGNKPRKKSTTIAEDELINKTEWSCWGSTSVHYLVLEPVRSKKDKTDTPKTNKTLKKKKPKDAAEQKAQREADDMLASLKKQLRNLDKKLEHDLNQRRGEGTTTSTTDPNQIISAITPENIGLSIRKIDSSHGHFTVTDIGSIRICVETSGSTINDAATNNSQDNISTGAAQSSSSVTTTNKSSEGGDQQQPNKSSTGTSALLDPKKFYAFTIKVGKQMQYNVKEIREAVQEDFPGRSYRFGTKVVTRMEKTTQQTWDYFGKIVNSWWKSM